MSIAQDLSNVPSTPSPADAATNVSTTAKLSWVASGATSYDVYLGTSTTPPKVANVLASAYAPTLQAGTTYYWKVVARSSSSTTSGPLWIFKTAAAGSGPTVALLSPANGAVGAPLQPTKLTWQGSGATKGYDFYFGTSPTPTFRANTMNTYWAPDTKAGTKYYWRIVAKDGTTSTSSPIWSFTTKSTNQQPIDCVVSAWTLKNATTWSACSAGTQWRTETWIRTILVQPQYGGKACPLLTETRTATQSCSTLPPPPSTGLLGQSDLVYEGAFRVPAGSGTTSYNWGGTALSYHAGHNSLLMVGHDWAQQVGEFSIPTPAIASTVAGLPRATAIQPLTDVLAGKLKTIDGDTTNGVKIGGLTPVGTSLVVTAWSFYDAGPQKQTKSHFWTGQSFSALGTVTGPFQVGIGFQDIVPTDTTRIGGFVSGYMTTIPSAWQGPLGGTHLTGQGGGVSILARTSSGPSATVFNAAEIGVPNSPTKLVMGYPSDSSNPSSPLNHPALGNWGIDGGTYNGTQVFRGMVFAEGSRSILFFGWSGTDFCYGAGTDDPSLHKQPHPLGGHYCYDPVNSSKGTHGYPYRPVVWAYDANDFLAVKQGTKKSWDVAPYAMWTYTLPFQAKIVNGVDLGSYNIVGAAYDPAEKRIFVSAFRNDGDAPLIHVFKVP